MIHIAEFQFVSMWQAGGGDTLTFCDTLHIAPDLKHTDSMTWC